MATPPLWAGEEAETGRGEGTPEETEGEEEEKWEKCEGGCQVPDNAVEGLVICCEVGRDCICCEGWFGRGVEALELGFWFWNELGLTLGFALGDDCGGTATELVAEETVEAGGSWGEEAAGGSDGDCDEESIEVEIEAKILPPSKVSPNIWDLKREMEN